MTSTSPDPGALLRGAAAAGVEKANFDDALTVPFERRRVLRRAADRAAYDVASARSYTEVVDEARTAAHAEGWAAGHADGLAAAAAEVEMRRQQLLDEHKAAEADRDVATARALSALAAAMDEVHRARAAEATELLALAVEVAVELAESLVGHDLAARGTPGLDAVRRAAVVAPPDGPLVVRLHPADAAGVAPVAVESAAGRPVTVLADERVAAGDCIAEVGDVQIDASVRTALARAREVLGG